MTTPPPSSSSRAIPVRDSNAQDITNFSTSVGGSIYGTTPGGTRIKYDRNALLFMRNSPLSKTPPTNMPYIPGITSAPTSAPSSLEKKDAAFPQQTQPQIPQTTPKTKAEKDDELFEME